jgi:hypothetical protein
MQPSPAAITSIAFRWETKRRFSRAPATSTLPGTCSLRAMVRNRDVTLRSETYIARGGVGHRAAL